MTRATGKMIMLYHGLDIAVKNKQTDDTTAFGERFCLFDSQQKYLNSNPAQGGEVREGTIDYIRDPERSVFALLLQILSLSGITSTLSDGNKKMEAKLAGMK